MFRKIHFLRSKFGACRHCFEHLVLLVPILKTNHCSLVICFIQNLHKNTIYIYICRQNLSSLLGKWCIRRHPQRTTRPCTTQYLLCARPFYPSASRNIGVSFPQSRSCGSFNPTTSNGSEILSIRCWIWWLFTEMTFFLKLRFRLSGPICSKPFLLLPLRTRIMPSSSKISLCFCRLVVTANFANILVQLALAQAFEILLPRD